MVLTPAGAQARIVSALRDVAPLGTERVALADAAGRALASDLVAPADLPPFDASTMDGYALRAADVRRAGARLPVVFDVFAGEPARAPLAPGTCCRIFTGAPLPAGADAVEQQEQVRRAGGAAVFARAAERGRFVRRRGSDLATGDVAAVAGAAIDAGTVALAAAFGHSTLKVHRRPHVAILPTGDEIVSLGAARAPGQIVETNGHALAVAAREAGAEPRVLPVVRDDLRALRRALAAARGADALVTTGGVSVGSRDLVRAALVAAGARLHFWRVAMRPGKPFTFGRWGRTAVFGLPGNPASALVTFELYVRPALRALAGLPGSGRLHVAARLGSAQEKPRDLALFLRVRLRAVRGELVAEPLRTQASGNLSSVAGHDALAVLPAGRARLARGARIEVIVLRPPPLGA
jgi:molybdopterin molybdotransferase